MNVTELTFLVVSVRASISLYLVTVMKSVRDGSMALFLEHQ